MKTTTYISILSLLAACSEPPANSIEMITAVGQQDSLFKGLMAVAQYHVPESSLNDSLAFLVLPVQASCPSCRKKTIDSIMKYQANLSANHFVIIAANGGRKTIRGYFQEQDYELPVMQNGQQLILDSLNMAYKYDLYKDRPTLYYTYGQKAYKKVGAVPSTVRADLCEFFSGHRPLTE